MINSGLMTMVEKQCLHRINKLLLMCFAVLVLFSPYILATDNVQSNLSQEQYNSVLQIDSILAEFNSLSDYKSANTFFDFLYDSGFVEDHYNFLQDTPTDTLRAQVWYWAAEYYNDYQLYETALNYALRVLPIYFAASNDQELADVYQLISVIYIRLSDFDNALRYAKKCYDIDIKDGDPDKISSSLNTIGSIYIEAKMPDKAEKYILKAIDYSEQANNNYRLALIYGVASEMYHTLGKDQLSLDYSTKAYRMEQKLGRENKAAMRLSQMSSAMLALGNTTDAKENLLKAIPVFVKYQNYHSLAIAYKQMGSLEHIEGNDSLAIDYLQKALPIFYQQHDLYNEASVHKGLYDILRNTNPTTALEHNDRYNELRDSLYKRDASSTLSAFEVGYENSELQKQNEYMRILMRNMNVLIIVLSFVFLLAIIFVLRHFRKKNNEDVTIITPPHIVSALPSDSNSENNKADNVDFMSNEGDEPDSYFQQALERVVHKLKLSDLTVESLASELRMHPQTLRRRMLTVTGKLPKAYITDIQMEKAQELLRSNRNMMIADIAMQCGFTEASSFVRTFKKKYGVTPTQYREQHSLE